MRPIDLLLIGGGHANVAVLADWARRGVPGGLGAALVTPRAFLTYSGMVPGWIAGDYVLEETRVDLATLAARAGVELVLGRCAALDPERRICTLESGERIAFRHAAIDCGGVGQGARVLGEDPRVVDVRPMDEFTERLARWRAENRAGARRIAVVGGGAGGVELAFALRNMAGRAGPCEVMLIAGEGGVLPGFAPRLRRLAARELARQRVEVVAADARMLAGQLRAAGDSLEPVDLVVAALGSAAPAWPAQGGLDCDPAGFIRVDRHHRSLSHAHILAAGDVCARVDRVLAHSGVHAVHAGPVIAANLRALATGLEATAGYTPRPASLYLIATGQGHALASYGPLAAQGRWAMRLKRWIDRRWIGAYAKLAAAIPRSEERPLP
ncbi:MAG: NADH dehydrogenase [Erythrobacter sp. SCN 68-10]|nr:MAG: NADH dehydrogenase [Erythrobacter sp. SCN 68-10]